MKTALFIPIKLNNQRLPGKNVLDLCGRPLCDYIFRTVRDLAVVEEKFVYCSDTSIRQYIPSGIDFLKRDSCLDSPEVKGTDIISAFLQDVNADIYVITHATQPFTKGTSIESALIKVKSGEYDSAFSAMEMYDYCWFDGKPLNYSMDEVVVTQELKPVYKETGAFYIFRREVFASLGRRIGSKPYIFIVDAFEAIDVDTAEDFRLAEAAAAYLNEGARRNGKH